MGRRLFLIRRNLLSVNRNTKETKMKAREELLKEIGALKRDVAYWEAQAKTIEIRKVELEGELLKAKAELKLWMGTGV
tara:strand:+ start:4628 stop:4861 length:234 start_codon:yes stop_codon:yes gene_type:complete